MALKHVIFLGAGASKSSGYPLAYELRLWLSSPKYYLRKVKELNAELPEGKDLETFIATFFARHEKAVELFRKGGFATLDEFCKLTSGHGSMDKVDEMRAMTRGALGLFNPEDTFEQSDYYPFIQALFQSNLWDLREDITVLSYNYDQYFPYLLLRAYNQRRLAANVEGGDLTTMNRLTSGFFDHRDTTWIKEQTKNDRFQFLQLHGTVSSGLHNFSNNSVFFGARPVERLQAVLEHSPGVSVPPIIFPWETVGSDGQFSGKSSDNLGQFLPIFEGIWKIARAEVQKAHKISFIGLSMHPFMEDGLRFLFDGKTGSVETVVANKGNNLPFSREAKNHWSRYPTSPMNQTAKMLAKVAPKMMRLGRLENSLSSGDFTPCPDFLTFIREQMYPLENLPMPGG